MTGRGRTPCWPALAEESAYPKRGASSLARNAGSLAVGQGARPGVAIRRQTSFQAPPQPARRFLAGLNGGATPCDQHAFSIAYGGVLDEKNRLAMRMPMREPAVIVGHNDVVEGDSDGKTAVMAGLAPHSTFGGPRSRLPLDHEVARRSVCVEFRHGLLRRRG